MQQERRPSLFISLSLPLAFLASLPLSFSLCLCSNNFTSSPVRFSNANRSVARTPSTFYRFKLFFSLSVASTCTIFRSCRRITTPLSIIYSSIRRTINVPIANSSNLLKRVRGHPTWNKRHRPNNKLFSLL